MKLLKPLIIMSLCVSLILPITPTRAAQKTSCREVITACDEALATKDKELALSNLALKERSDNELRLAGELDDANGKLESIWRNPYVLLGLGFLTAVIVRK